MNHFERTKIGPGPGAYSSNLYNSIEDRVNSLMRQESKKHGGRTSQEFKQIVGYRGCSLGPGAYEVPNLFGTSSNNIHRGDFSFGSKVSRSLQKNKKSGPLSQINPAPKIIARNLRGSLTHSLNTSASNLKRDSEEQSSKLSQVPRRGSIILNKLATTYQKERRLQNFKEKQENLSDKMGPGRYIRLGEHKPKLFISYTDRGLIPISKNKNLDFLEKINHRSKNVDNISCAKLLNRSHKHSLHSIELNTTLKNQMKKSGEIINQKDTTHQNMRLKIEENQLRNKKQDKNTKRGKARMSKRRQTVQKLQKSEDVRLHRLRRERLENERMGVTQIVDNGQGTRGGGSQSIDVQRGDMRGQYRGQGGAGYANRRSASFASNVRRQQD